MRQRNQKRERETLGQWFSRHMLGFILGGSILFFIWGVNDSYQIYSQGQLHLERYQSLATTIQAVLTHKKPLQALVPHNFLHPEELALSVSQGKTSLLQPPKGRFTLPKATVASSSYTPLTFTGEKQLHLKALDNLGRAQGAHIQMQNKDKVSSRTRSPRLTFNPVGWHNYNLPYQDEKSSGKAWLMNRGHLVGFQFSGLGDEARNLTPETAWLNAGAYMGMNDQNQESQLYIENQLAQWLTAHPKDWLDLEVVPLYKGENLIPDRIQLTFMGLSATGENFPIRIPTTFGVEIKGGAERVTLKNYSPNAILNYKTGTALPR